jgi:hypothetical protein
MEYFAGLDVSVKDTSVCIVDEAGKIARESESRERAGRFAGGSEEPWLPLQADRTGSRTVIAMAL